MIEFNPGSGNMLSYLFFGGTIKVTEKIPEYDELGNKVKYKSGIKKGETKYKNIEIERKIKGLGLKPNRTLETKKEGIYKTDEAVLSLIAKRKNHDAGKIAELMLRIRYLQKQISTYYESTEVVVHDFDSCVHHELCHFGYDAGNDRAGGGVVSGRLSGRNPNMLNQPKPSDSVVKQHFVARNGLWITADFSAIEPVAQAELSRDPKLIEDIMNGRDEHVKYLALKERLPYEVVHQKCKIEKLREWDEKRSKIKAFTFKRKYGGGAKSISEATGLTIEEVKDIFQQEERAYPVLMHYQNRNKKIVEAHGELQTIFGRILKFQKYEAFEWQKQKGIFETYKPTEIVNWPVQSTGSADLTLIMIGHFWRKYAIHNRDKYLMVNTVYDSLDIDCKPKYAEECKEHLKCLTDVKEVLYKYFKYEWVVPVKIDCKQGESWYHAGI